jgi:hypothetical protein
MLLIAVGTELICDFSLSVAPLFCHQLSVCLAYTLLPNDESTRQQLMHKTKRGGCTVEKPASCSFWDYT